MADPERYFCHQIDCWTETTDLPSLSAHVHAAHGRVVTRWERGAMPRHPSMLVFELGRGGHGHEESCPRRFNSEPPGRHDNCECGPTKAVS